jgi:Ca2+-binding RTX toxin-like protein
MAFAARTASTGRDGNSAPTHIEAANTEHRTSRGDSLCAWDNNTNTTYGEGRRHHLRQSGNDKLYGGDGADAFVPEATTAYNNIDILADFSIGDGDKVDVKDLMSRTLSEFVQLVNDGFGNGLLQVDRDSTASTYSVQTWRS